MISRMLGPVSTQSFLSDYYHNLPLAIAGGASPILEVVDQVVLSELISAPTADLMVVRRGEQFPGEFPKRLEDAQQLVSDGWTIVVRHAERTSASLAVIADEFQRELAGSVDVHCYWTPAGQFGFGWHYDAEEVFVVQLAGVKEYRLRKNTVHPWPVTETLPANMRYEAEGSPLLSCALHAGDWLYIPSGYWHRADALEASISLAIGVVPITGVDVFDFLRSEVLKSLRWRQRLPSVGSLQIPDEAGLHQTYAELFAEFGSDLAAMLGSGATLKAFLAHLQSHRFRQSARVENPVPE